MLLVTEETRLAGPKRSDDVALRFAVANLLRVARSGLDDARLLMRKRHGRNAAIFLRQALAHVIEALAASEHGWPLERLASRKVERRAACRAGGQSAPAGAPED
jgi:hypothetical protein